MPPERARAGAANGKSENAFRTISEVSAELDLPQHVLRFWETRFSQIKPMKRNGGRRLYRPDHIALLRGIKALLYEDGMTIKGVQKILREQGPRAVAARGREDAGTQVGAGGVPADVTERLSALRERLEERMAAAGESEGGEGAAPEEPGRRDPADARRADAALDDADIARMRDSIARLEALLTQLERD